MNPNPAGVRRAALAARGAGAPGVGAAAGQPHGGAPHPGAYPHAVRAPHGAEGGASGNRSQPKALKFIFNRLECRRQHTLERTLTQYERLMERKVGLLESDVNLLPSHPKCLKRRRHPVRHTLECI